MNITKRDVLELRRRLKKKECTFGQMCGCYVNSNKNILLKFSEPFLDLQEDEFYKYLEIAKKTLSGTLGNNLLELEFARTEDASNRQSYLLALKESKLKNDELLDRLYEQIIAQYAYPGNYLILLFHDVYDVVTRTKDRAKLDESEEIYQYLLCAICPVELSKPGLGYREEENRIGVCTQDWVVSMPEIGFVYPAFSQRGSDVHAVMYYVKSGKDSHPEFVESVLGCAPQRTATEEKDAFQSIVKDAFGEQQDTAENTFLTIQKNLNEIVSETLEEEDLPPVCLSTVTDVIADIPLPDEVKQQIEQAYVEEFGDTPPAAQNLLDPKLAALGAQREHTAALEQKVLSLQQQLSEQAQTLPMAPSDAAIILKVPEEKAHQIRTQILDGQKFLLIPVAEEESACINGTVLPVCDT